jgi:peptidoglycan/LPS O-acetylase OafA/YrhL
VASSSLANLESSLKRIYSDDFFASSLDQSSPFWDHLAEPKPAPYVAPLAVVGVAVAAAVALSPEKVGRRGFLGRLATALAGGAASAVASVVPPTAPKPATKTARVDGGGFSYPFYIRHDV